MNLFGQNITRVMKPLEMPKETLLIVEAARPRSRSSELQANKNLLVEEEKKENPEIEIC